jgi:hypothetical protein
MSNPVDPKAAAEAAVRIKLAAQQIEATPTETEYAREFGEERIVRSRKKDSTEFRVRLKDERERHLAKEMLQDRAKLEAKVGQLARQRSAEERDHNARKPSGRKFFSFSGGRPA